MSSQENWKQLEQQIKCCHECEGLNSPKLGTENAPGYGSKKSKIVFIGQSLCGKPCIDAQIPFTGGSGIILDQSFKKADIRKRDIYITNVVKCHPVRNRKSHKYEIQNCSKYLNKELLWLKPEVIICLGKDAWWYFDSSIRKPSVKQVKLQNRNITFHFLYHPSYIMKKPLKYREEYICRLSDIINTVVAHEK